MSVVRALLAVLGSIFAMASLLLLALSIKRAFEIKRVALWRRAKATVTSVQFDVLEDEEELGILRVEFEVEGRSSSALDIGKEKKRVSSKDELLTQFAIGTTHEALVDPSQSAPSILVTGLAQAPTGTAILSAIFIFPAAALFGLGWYLGQR